MSFLAPWALWAAGAVSAAVVALHILASKNPRVTALPTTKFVPDVPLRATARALRLSDVALMVLRVAVVMLVGVAFARPEVTKGKRAVGRVVMVESTPGTGRNAAADSAMKYYGDGDIAFVFDSAAYRLPEKFPFAAVGAESFSPEPRHSLSAALAAGMRSASSLRGNADSVELVVVASFSSEEFDAATNAIRAAWPGRVRLVRFEEPAIASYRRQIFHDVRGSTLEDPVRASLAFAAHLDTGRIKTDSVRIDRGTLPNVDTTWTQYGLTLVRWPAALDSSGFPHRTRADTAGAVVVDDTYGTVVVAPFARIVDPPPGRVVARWADGSPAATERKMMNGCVRDVAIPLPRAGDLALRESMRRLVGALSMTCGEHGAGGYASDSVLAQLGGTGPLVATRALAARTASSSKLTTWLLVAALVLLLLEPFLSRQRASA